MSNLSFTKYHGAGNDFILIDNREGRFPVDDVLFIQRMCHRQFGIGADGVVLLCEDDHADFRMRIFNRDGHEAASCGNGLRCLVQFLQDLGIIQEKYRIKIQTKIVTAYFSQGYPVIDMGCPEGVRLDVETHWGAVHCVDTGVLHAVTFVLDVDQVDVLSQGALLRSCLQANVNFASLQEDRSIRVRTFEKGVEGETLSCGTGAAAVASIAMRLYGLPGPIQIHFRGGQLLVWEKEGRLFLSGSAEKVFTGSLYSHRIDP